MSITSPVRQALTSTRVLSTKPAAGTSVVLTKTSALKSRPIVTRPVPSTFALSHNQPGSPSTNTLGSQVQIRKMSSVPTFGFSTREPSEEEKAIVNDVLKLYQLHPDSAAYSRYAPDATFHDPIGLAEGLEAVKAQFNGMPKVFSKSITEDVKYLDNPEVKPPSFQIALAQNYTMKMGGAQKLVNSKLTFHIDPSSKLIKTHDEEWDGKPNTTGEDGFFGQLNEWRKKATASMVKAGVDTTPPDQQKK